MLRILTSALLFLYASAPTLLWISYGVHTEYFMELCENLNNPGCQGKCQIKKMQQQESAKEKPLTFAVPEIVGQFSTTSLPFAPVIATRYDRVSASFAGESDYNKKVWRPPIFSAIRTLI
jgi:hypothetical protein